MENRLSLHQRQFLKGQTKFELRGEELHIATKNRQGATEHDMDLRYLSEKTSRASSKALAPTIFGWALIAAYAIGAVFIYRSLEPDTVGARLGVIGFFALFVVPFGVAFIFKGIKATYDVTLFYHRGDGSWAFSIGNKTPDRETAAAFIAALTEKIRSLAPLGGRIDGSGAGDNLADQISQLEQLRIRKVLSDEEFAAAKQRVLAMGGGGSERRIGF